MSDIKKLPESAIHVELVSPSPISDDEKIEQDRDYAGAQIKTDPREIRLVRKMDLRIMVSTVYLSRYAQEARLVALSPTDRY
jgi:hypothetical protein